MDFAAQYQSLDTSRPVVPCFLELTTPSIQEGIDACVAQGYRDFSVLPVLLFAARHNKFDVTNELDRAKLRHPELTFHYGRHFGISPNILDLWRDRLVHLDTSHHNPQAISPAETVLLVVGRGASDPDANGDVYKLARMLWEGSGYKTVEICFIGITHPRLEEGFRRARLYQPKCIIVLPHFLFTGVLVKKIFDVTQQQQLAFPEIQHECLPEIGLHPSLFQLVRERELETQLGQVQMNCEACKFRRAALQVDPTHNHTHGHTHGHAHGHTHAEAAHPEPHAEHPHHPHDHGHSQHGHNHDAPDVYADETYYHERVWQVP